MNTLSSQRSAPPHGQTATAGPSQPFPSSGMHRSPAQSVNQQPQPAQVVRRQNSKEDMPSRQGSGSDASALPSSASWANKDAPVNRARRASQVASRSSPSPKPANATSDRKPEESRRNEKKPAQAQSSHAHEGSSSTANQAGPSSSGAALRSQSPHQNIPLLDDLLKAVNSPDFRFVYSSAALPADEVALVENHPSLIDPYGGAKRRAMREKAEQEQAKQEAESMLLIQPSAATEDENPESGSLQLGGEPEDPHVGRNVSGRNGREPQSAIQPPSQQGTASNSIIGSPISPSHQFQGLNVSGRSLTPLQQQQLLLLKSANSQQAGLVDPLQAGIGSNSVDNQSRSGLFQNQMPQVGGGGMPTHARQSSRYSFANEQNGKSTPNQRLLGQQASLMQTTASNPLSIPAAQQGLGSQFYTSGVQGPPPGLKSAGTPPISGGGMFAQGHGFTSTMNNNLGLGGNANKQDANPELMRELLRGRGGTNNAGGMQGHEAAKREFMFSSLQSHQTPPPSMAPAPGLLSSLYGHQSVPYHDSVPQKQKKKGKKHRHANTSSGGGGVVDLADPSILQARMHQGNAAATAQGLYGSQGQGGYNHSNMIYGGGFNRW